MKRKLLIAMGAVALLGVAQAYGQERTVDNYPIKGGEFYGSSDYYLQRVDANADGTGLDTPNATSYVTKSVAVPFFVAPNRITHPDWNPTSGVLNPQDYASPAANLVFSSQWIMKFKDASATGVDFGTPLAATDPHANKVTVTGNTLGEYVVQAQEQPQGEAFECMNGGTLDLPEFKLRVVSEPSISIDLAEQTAQDNTIMRLRGKELPAYDIVDGAGATVPAFLKGKKVIMVNTCNQLLFKGQAKVHLVNNKIEAWEDAQPTTSLVPENLRKFAFTIRRIEIKADKDHKATSVSQAGATDATVVYGDLTKEGSLYKKMEIIDKAVANVDLPSFSLTGTEATMDAVYFLSSPKDPGVMAIPANEQGGVVSAISHRSWVDPLKDKDAQNIKTYPFGDYAILVLRLNDKPITGPIYHVPSSLFAK